MIRKRARIAVLVGLALLVFATWQVAVARDRRPRKARKRVVPPAIAAAIRKAFPKAKIVKVEPEPHFMLLYEVKLDRNGQELEVELFTNGEVLSTEKTIRRNDLPKPVAAALAKVAGGAKIKELEQKEIRATISITRYKKPRNVYEAEFVKNGKTIEVKIATDGRIISMKTEDERERKVTLDQVPKAVRDTILKEAGKNKVREIEVETRRGKKIYEAEWIADGKEIEIKVSSDGKVISREVEDEDDDDEDDDDDDDDEEDDD